MLRKEGKRKEAPLWWSLHTRSSVNIDNFSRRSFARNACILLLLFFLSWENPDRALQSTMPFTSEPDSRSYRKSALRGLTRESERTSEGEGTGKGTWKWKATFRASGVAKGPWRRRMIEPCGRACASREARPVQGHRAAHATQSSLRPAKTRCPLSKFGGSIVVITRERPARSLHGPENSAIA